MILSRGAGCALGALVAVAAAGAGAAGGYYWRELRQPGVAAMSRSTAGQPMAVATAGEGHAAMAAEQPKAKAKPLFHCGMHPWIIMDHPGTCPICKMNLTPVQQTSQTETAGAPRKILYYWDPAAGESSIVDKPGDGASAPPLVPVYQDEVTGGPAVSIDPAVVQNMGVQTAVVTRGALTKSVRTVGEIQLPDDAVHEVNLKISGWVQKLYADKLGMHLHKGQPLFDLYSPDLQVAQEELIAAAKAVDALDPKASDAVRKDSTDVLASARRKLELWDLDAADIDAVIKDGHARRTITFRSPVDGHLEDKAIVQGSAVQAGTKLMQIADHTTVWLESQVYESQLPMVAVGQTADATLDAIPGRTFTGKVIFIDPHLDHMNRTTAVRVQLNNAGETLRPGMYATVKVHTRPVEGTVLVPRSAVIDTGARQVVFVAAGEGHFSPRLVNMGLGGDDGRVQITRGLAPGETVVTSGQFLMDVESRAQEAFEKMNAGDSGKDANAPAMAAEASMPASMPASVMSSSAPSTMPAAGESDAVVTAYLDIARYLQGENKTPADVAVLLAASEALAKSAMEVETKKLAAAVSQAAAGMKGQSIDVQRKQFEKTGAAVVALVDRDPPSAKVSGKIYVVNCPMERADWLQITDAVSNPFLPSMRTCGSVTRTILLGGGK